MIVVRSRLTVILPKIPKEEERVHEEDEPSVDERILTIAMKQELSRRSTQHGKHTTHKHDMIHNQAWCMTKLDEATHGNRWCIQDKHIKASLNEAENNI